MTILKISGKKPNKIFKDESGGHRWQRCSPTERRGRTHTSTITVAIIPETSDIKTEIDDSELEVMTCRGSGKGGQHKNTTDSAVQIKHVPSGLIVRCESERSQHQNKESALSLLQSRLCSIEMRNAMSQEAQDRKQQIGSGMRGDKRRTIRQKDNHVIDHLTGKVWRYSDYVKGKWK
jgi:peptide chain release factor 1